MVAFSNLHILTIRNGEVYVHHFWLIFVVLVAIASAASSKHGSGK